MNSAYRPMLATLVDEPFDDKAWVFETKWDDFRLITEKRGRAVRLWSRNGIDVTTRYAVLLPALHKIEASCVRPFTVCSRWSRGLGAHAQRGSHRYCFGNFRGRSHNRIANRLCVFALMADAARRVPGRPAR
jgi:hypothetical protein